MRRATHINEEGRLHVIMFADQLEFEVAKNTETSLKKLTNNPSNTGSLIPDLKYLRSV